MPVSWVNLLTIKPLLMLICFVSNVKDLIHKIFAKCSMVMILSHFFIFSHFFHALAPFIDHSVGLCLHSLKHFFLLLDCHLLVELFSLLILLFSKMPVFNNDFLALVSPPYFVVKLFFLVWLPFHQIKYKSFTIFQLKLWHKLFLLTDEPTPPLFSLFARLICQCLFGSLFEPSGGQSEGAICCCLCLHRGSCLGSKWGFTTFSLRLVETISYSLSCDFFLDSRVDTLGSEGLLKIGDSICNFIVCVLKLLNCNGVILLSLLVIEF